jgi:DNA-binding FadR family transcriptional regulator
MSETIYYDLKQVSGPPASMATHVARGIGTRIVSSAYLPGNLVEDEAALARHYKVSRSVIRDAVKILVGKGLLEVRRGIGTRVRSRANWGLLDNDVLAWHQSVPPDPDTLLQLMDVRQMIEPQAARLAAERASAADIAGITAALIQMEQNTDSIGEFVVADAAFHRAILRATGNEFLIALEGLIFSALLSSIRLTNRRPRDNKTSLSLHRNVAEAIARRNGAAAEDEMRTMLADASARLRERIAMW